MRLTKSKRWYYTAYIITCVSAWVCCILPTLITGMIKLPMIATKDADSTLTGSFTLCLVCCAYPLYKGVVRLIKSPSAPLIMWILFALTYLLWKINHDTLGAMVTVFLVSAIGNTVGAVLFFVARAFKEKWRFCGEVTILGGGNS